MKDALRGQHGDLIARAIELGRFATRSSNEWRTSDLDHHSPIGAEARKKLRDKSSKAAAAMRSAAVELRAAEQAVTDALQESDASFESRCRERDVKLRAAEEAAEAAPATAVKLFDEEMERGRPAEGAAGDVAKVGRRRFAVVLSGLVQPLLNQVEKDLASKWLRSRADALGQQLTAFEEAVAPCCEALERLSPDGGRRIGRWCKASWSGVLGAVVGDLLKAIDAGDQGLLISAVEALQTKQLPVDVAIELAKVRGIGSDKADLGALDGWGPAQTFEVVCDVILSNKRASGKSASVHAGDSAVRKAILDQVRSGNLEKLPLNKASQYLTPKGRLSKVGWIFRKGDRVIVTEAGAERWAEKHRGS